MLKDIPGKVQEEVGELIGNNKQQVKGLGKQIAGEAVKAHGDAKAADKDASRNS